MISIAIDGPSGAGKSSIAKELARRLDIMYLDTGAMYRAVGLKAVRNGINPNDREGVLPLLHDTAIDIEYTNGTQRVILDGEDVSSAIREHTISKAASDISKIPEVREFLVNMQRDIACKHDIVLDGRDITSYVLVDTPFKFYLTASVDVRAERRYKELIAKGQNVELDAIKKDIIDRDYNDTHRDCCPLTRTADSYYIDSSNMSIAEVIDTFIAQIDRVKSNINRIK